VPVIVVGNISVGGTGKTPIVRTVVERLQSAGFKPGIVSRGYGAEKASLPRMVELSTPVALAGDEPALLARDSGAPVCICKNRSAAVQALIDEQHVNVVVSDDGLQHYAMSRDVEIAVVDGQRGFGNRFVLPAGPLREPVSRLRQVNAIAVQCSASSVNQGSAKDLSELLEDAKAPSESGHFHLHIKHLKSLHDNQSSELSTLQGQQVHAVAGLGNPQRFFDSLRYHGLRVVEHALPDHHRFTEADLAFDDALPVLVTGKDAVKIRELEFDLRPFHEVCVVAQLDDKLSLVIDRLINDLKSGPR